VLTRELVRYRFTGGEPAGAYTWFTALTEAGTARVIGGDAGIRAFPFRFGP
jgi:hypothetical protein